MKWLHCGWLAASLALAAVPAAAVESDPLPVPEGGARAKAVALYNEGVKVMLDKRYAEAQRLFEQALELNPKLAQAYMYRGVLFTQMGDLPRARGDLERLKGLDRELAAKLERVIADSAVRDDRDGLAPQLEGIY
jgi:tetratricopeptide (TPR) repeat protein